MLSTNISKSVSQAEMTCHRFIISTLKPASQQQLYHIHCSKSKQIYVNIKNTKHYEIYVTR